MSRYSVVGKISTACCIFLMLFVIGCSEKDTAIINSESSSEQVVTASLEQRVQDRWQALIQRDFERAYTFETPAYREVYGLAHYKKQFGNRVGWISAEVQSVEKEEPIAQVIVNVRYKALLPFGDMNGQNIVESATFLKEKWIQEGGLWFHMKE